MSEEGWRTFLAADDVDDWVVLHGGATAAFRVGSMAEAVRLAEAIAGVPGCRRRRRGPHDRRLPPDRAPDAGHVVPRAAPR